MVMFRKQLKQNHTTNRNFSYSKGDVTLNFSLRTDVKGQLKDFLEILNCAEKEVEEELNKKL